MNYELFNFRQFFDDIVYGRVLDETGREELKSEIKLESLRILAALKNNVCHLNPQKARQYIVLHQESINILLKKFNTGLSKTDAELVCKSKRELIKILLNAAEILLLDLEQYFPNYFNYQSELPPGVNQTTIDEIGTSITDLIKLFENHEIYKRWSKFIENLQKSISQSEKKLTYEKSIYWKLFLRQLTNRIENQPAKPETIDILLVIISVNFNHPAFYQFFNEYLITEFENCENLSIQYKTLCLLKKCIQQVYIITELQYNNELISIKESLNRFIDCELEYLKSMDDIASNLNHYGLIDSKYKVTLTVKQLAIFIHLQVTAKIIIIESPKYLHEYIANKYSTTEIDRISAKSFKNAYYNASVADLEKVIDKISTMLAIAQEKLQ